MQKDTKVISGFPGVGKTTFFESKKDGSVLDSDSSNFSWENQEERIRHTEWPQNYIDHIKENLGKVDFIFVSSHKEVREALEEAGIVFSLVYPSLDMKEEYIERYKARGNAEAFVKLLEANYDEWISELQKQENCWHIVLRPGEYLSDAL